MEIAQNSMIRLKINDNTTKSNEIKKLHFINNKKQNLTYETIKLL